VCEALSSSLSTARIKKRNSHLAPWQENSTVGFIEERKAYFGLRKIQHSMKFAEGEILVLLSYRNL
jgi:hypothetical protein